MKKYTLHSKLFGYITVQSDHLDDPDDMWLDVNPYLSVNIFCTDVQRGRYACIWAMKVGEDGLSSFNEEIEDYTECKIVKVEDLES